MPRSTAIRDSLLTPHRRVVSTSFGVCQLVLEFISAGTGVLSDCYRSVYWLLLITICRRSGIIEGNNVQRIWLIQQNGVALRYLTAWNESTDSKYFGTDGWCGCGCQSFDACALQTGCIGQDVGARQTEWWWTSNLDQSILVPKKIELLAFCLGTFGDIPL